MPQLGRTRIFAAARCRTINSLTPLSALASMELPHSTCHESKLSQSALSLCRSAAAPGRASKAMNKRTCTPSAVSFSLPSWAALEALSRAPCCQTPLPIAWVPRQHKTYSHSSSAWLSGSHRHAARRLHAQLFEEVGLAGLATWRDAQCNISLTAIERVPFTTSRKGQEPPGWPLLSTNSFRTTITDLVWSPSCLQLSPVHKRT